MLIVGNIINTISTYDLLQTFPEAVDAVIPFGDKGNVKGYAYLVFGSETQMEKAYKKYTSQRISICEHRLRIMKYAPPKDIPMGLYRAFLKYRKFSV